MEKMTVLFPIEVPSGKHCWKWLDSSCEHFDNEGGHSKCEMGFRFSYPDKTDDEGLLKPVECSKLECKK